MRSTGTMGVCVSGVGGLATREVIKLRWPTNGKPGKNRVGRWRVLSIHTDVILVVGVDDIQIGRAHV